MLLNSSSIDEHGALKLVQLGNTLAQEVSMLILQVATTSPGASHWTAQWNTYNQYLHVPSTSQEREGWAGQMIVSAQAKTAFAKDCKQSCASKGYEEALLKAWDCPTLHEMKNQNWPALTWG